MSASAGTKEVHMEKTKELLRAVCQIPAVSGQEHRALNEFKELCSPYFDKIEKDAVGNIIMFKSCGKEGAKKLLIDAHLDTIGLMVSGHNTDCGTVSVVSLGGFDARTLPSSEVIIYGSEVVYGVIGSTPPHLSKGNSIPEISSIMIDVGVKGDELCELVPIGSFVFGKGDFCEINNGYVLSSGLDDRACLCSAILAVANAPFLEYDVYVVASASEEIGRSAIRTAVFNIEPDYVISTDVGFGTEPDLDKRYCIDCKSGPAVDISALTNRDFSRAIIALAKEKGIPCQVVVEPMGTGTNNDIISVTGKGCINALLSLPLKAMHTSCESVNLADVKHLADLLTAVITSREDKLC